MERTAFIAPMSSRMASGRGDHPADHAAAEAERDHRDAAIVGEAQDRLHVGDDARAARRRPGRGAGRADVVAQMADHPVVVAAGVQAVAGRSSTWASPRAACSGVDDRRWSCGLRLPGALGAASSNRASWRCARQCCDLRAGARWPTSRAAGPWPSAAGARAGKAADRGRTRPGRCAAPNSPPGSARLRAARHGRASAARRRRRATSLRLGAVEADQRAAACAERPAVTSGGGHGGAVDVAAEQGLRRRCGSGGLRPSASSTWSTTRSAMRR